MQFRAIILALLLATPFVMGAGLTAHSPVENATVDVTIDKFTFSTDDQHREVVLLECSILVNGTVNKKLGIYDKVSGISRHFTLAIPAGTYTWSISCSTEGPALTTPTRTVHVIEPIQSDVIVEPTGVTRGSLRHEFEMETTGDQPPIYVPDVSPGDYISVIVQIPPSKMTKEFFFKTKLVEDGVPYARLTHQQEQFAVFEHQNTTLFIGTAPIIVYLKEFVGSRGTFIFYPYANTTTAVEPEETPEEPEEPEEEPEEDLLVCAQDVFECPDGSFVSRDPENGCAFVACPEVEMPPEPVEPPTEPKERQGVFSWVLSLLARMFGA